MTLLGAFNASSICDLRSEKRWSIAFSLVRRCHYGSQIVLSVDRFDRRLRAKMMCLYKTSSSIGLLRKATAPERSACDLSSGLIASASNWRESSRNATATSGMTSAVTLTTGIIARVDRLGGTHQESPPTRPTSFSRVFGGSRHDCVGR
jgi:hypothetical protein